MPKKTKTTEEHLKTIELLVAGLLMNQEKKPFRSAARQAHRGR